MSDWIKWGGGDCPVPAYTLVYWRCRDGKSPGDILRSAGELRWSHNGSCSYSDIIEYRVAKPPEYTGGSVSYYRVTVGRPTSEELGPYTAECNDIIEALGMNYAEGNAFKAIWRRCAARTLGKAKAGYKDGLYDAEKVVFFGERMVAQEKNNG